MLKPTSVVIDKSFLQGCKQNHLEEIIKNHRILLTAELANEIFTSQDAIFKRCFEKLLKFKQCIDIIEHLGTLFKIEIERQIPASPISSYFLRGELNSNFNFNFNKDQINHVKDFNYDIEILCAKDFEKVVLEIRNNFPQLKIDDIKNPEIICKIYDRLRTNELPPTEKINEQWAIFRRLQVDLIAAIEYLQSFRNGSFNISTKNKEHNQVDFRICVFALLAKGLAAKDKLIIRYFRYICPEGYLFTF